MNAFLWMINMFVSYKAFPARKIIAFVRLILEARISLRAWCKKTSMKPLALLTTTFSRDYRRFDGVRPIQIHLLRIVFTLTLVFVGSFSWGTLFNFEGSWKPVNAVAFCMWAAYSTMSVLGILKPLKMLPIILLQIFYKVVWLIVVAYPLWIRDELAGSEAESMTRDFMWVILPIIAMPWGYFFRGIFTKSVKMANPAA